MKHTLCAIALLTACSGPSTSGIENTEAPRVPDPETYDKASDDSGRGISSEPYEGATNTWGEPAAFDDPRGEPDPNAVATKAEIAELWGWGVDSILRERCKNSQNQPVPCSWHYEPYFTSLNSMQDVLGQLKGRCGAYYSNRVPPLDLQGFACAMPFSYKVAGKTWSWKFDQSACGGTAAQKTTTLNALRNAFSSASAGTNWSFPEVASNPVINVKCSNATDANYQTVHGALATAVPTGTLTFYGSAPFSLTEQCSSNASLDRRFTQVSDEFWAYSFGNVLINFDYMWKLITNQPVGKPGDVPTKRCTPQYTADPSGFAYRSIQLIVKHELGHLLGFVHQNDIGGGTQTTNPMSGSATCELMDANPNYRQYMKDTLFDEEFPNLAPAIHVWDEDLSCYKPD